MLELTISGLFEVNQLQQFALEKRAALGRLGCAPNQHAALVDVAECSVQSGNVAAMLHSIIADPRYRAKRIAFVVCASLTKLQLERIFNSPDVRYFEDRAIAEAWLLEG